MEDKEESKAEGSLPPAAPTLSEEATKSLFDLLVKRGYLHDGVDPILADPERGNPTLEDADEDDVPNLSPEDATCQVVLLQEDGDGSNYCCTYTALEKKLRRELEISGGRCAMKKLVAALRLHSDQPILRILKQSDSENLFQQGDEVITSQYLDRVVQEVFDATTQSAEGESLEKAAGFVLVSDIANSHKFHLPMDMTFKALQERLPEKGLEILHLEQGATLVSNDYMKRYKTEVLKIFSALREPVTVSDICHAHRWDVGVVASWVQEACQNKELSGDFHGDSNANKVGSLYTPHAHVEAQRHEVDELFGAQGYMTASRGATLGLSKSKMGEYIQQSFPSAVIVSESLVVAAETILNPLEAVLQEAIATNGFVDLQAHVPADILEQEEDAKLILNNHVLPALAKEDEDGRTSTAKATKKRKKKSNSTPKSSQGVVILCSAAGGVFVSEGMIRNFQQKAVPGLIAEYAKERAKQLDAAEVAGESSAQNTAAKSKAASGKKKGRKGKKGSKVANQEEENAEQSEDDVVPLLTLVKAMGTEHPELMEADLATKDALEVAESDPSCLPQLSWERKNDRSHETDANALCNEGLICELCRSALYNEEFVSNCQRSIEIELISLQSARMSKASVSRKDAATKVRNVESAFEEAFVDACNLLQAQAKFLEYVESSDDVNKELIDKLTTEFLQGCCADFTSRLTQYCLFKNEIDALMFKFVADDAASVSEQGEEDKTQEAVQPPYCISPDLSIRQYPSTFLSLTNETDEQSKDPLPKLREVLPGSIGVTLARQWVMCGGTCYHGGTKVDESGNEFTRPGDLDKFRSHVEENCLSLCGLPFKKLDKKSEKQFLFARRQQLLRKLEEAPKDDAAMVLDLTIVLLFQQAKNVVAFGSALFPDILKILTAERKVGEEVGEALTRLSECLESAVDSALIDTVRECGLSRDISKHKIS